MVKLHELKTDRLKKELANFGAKTTGTKVELQERLRQNMLAANMDPETMEFEENVLPSVSGSSEVNPRSENQQDNGVLEILKSFTSDISKRMDRNESYVRENLESMLSIMEQNRRDTLNSCEFFKRNVDMQLQEVKKTTSEMEVRFGSEMDLIKQRLEQLQCHSAVAGTAMVTSGVKLKPPAFDGSTKLSVFKLQFETVADKNCWSDGDKASALIVSLTGSAADVLQTIPSARRGDYEVIMDALQRKYGSEHLKQVHRLEMKSRVQRSNESLQSFAADVERLAQLVYGDCSAEELERSKVEAFIDGIRDPETKRFALISQKSTFAEVMGAALAQEAASMVCERHFKIRRMELTAESTKGESASRFTGKCYLCDKIGHMARNCDVRKKNRQFSARATEDQKVVDNGDLLN